MGLQPVRRNNALTGWKTTLPVRNSESQKAGWASSPSAKQHSDGLKANPTYQRVNGLEAHFTCLTGWKPILLAAHPTEVVTRYLL